MANWGLRAALSAAAMVLLTGAGQRVDTSGGEEAANEIVRTEAAFQAAVQANGISAAFNEYGQPESIVFTPDPTVVGRYYAEARPGVLQWRPEAVASSSGGDLAASTGPGRYTSPSGQVYTTWYTSIWLRRGPVFRFAVDAGVETDGDYLNAEPTPYELTVARGRPGGGFDLTRLEESYARDAARDARRAVLDRLHEQRGRVVRDGPRPSIGRAQAQTRLASTPAQVTLRFRDGSVSNTGDLAYAWGEANWTGPEGAQRGYYVHVWLREGRDWRLIIDHLQTRREPQPEPAPAPVPAADPAAAPATTPAPADPATVAPPTVAPAPATQPSVAPTAAPQPTPPATPPGPTAPAPTTSAPATPAPTAPQG